MSVQGKARADGWARNVVVVCGVVAAAPQRWETAAGEPRWSFDVTVLGDGRDTVPVTWADDRAGALAEGDAIAVRGRVRKRFLRSAAGTRPRTDVWAEQVVVSRRGRSGVSLARLLEHAGALLAPD